MYSVNLKRTFQTLLKQLHFESGFFICSFHCGLSPLLQARSVNFYSHLVMITQSNSKCTVSKTRPVTEIGYFKMVLMPCP